MDAISLLMSEHRLIVRVTEALDVFAEEIERGLEDKAELARFARFIREFADARHHGKEESILFQAMIAAGFPRDAGPIGVMLGEHREGRERVAVLVERAAQNAPFSAVDRAEVVDASRGYASLLRGHILKEDQVLYPMARARLSSEVKAFVDHECALFEKSQPAGSGAELVELGEALIARHRGSQAAREMGDAP